MVNNNTEMFKNSLYNVYTSNDGQDINFKAIRLHDCEDNEEVRIYLEYNGKLIKGVQVPLSRLNEKMKEIINHGVMVSYADRANLLKEVYDHNLDIPVIDKIDGLGWQYDREGEVVAFAGSEFIGADGNVKLNDIEAGLPAMKGAVDMDLLNTYMRKNVVREIAMLYNLTAPVAGLLKSCFILSLCGKSSTGKTTLAKLALSQSNSPEYERLCKTLNTTDNASEKGLEGIKGLGVLLDDTSLTNKGFDWDRFLYRLSTGKTKERLNKNCQVSEVKRFYSTIVLTTETPILSKVDADREGNNGRIIEIPIKEGIAFDNDVECRSMELYYKHNYGITLSSLVKKIMELGGETVKDKVYMEELELMKKYSNQEVVVKRHFLEIAALRVTAGLVNQYLGYQFSIEKITDYLMENIKESLEDTREMQTGNIAVEKIYPELVKAGNIGNCKIIDEVKYYPVKNTELKKIVNTHANGMTFAQVKQILWQNHLLYKQGNSYSITQNINGKSERCLLIKGEE